MIPEPVLNRLYEETILDHYKKPRNFQKLDHATQYARGANPFCGDDYHLYLRVDEHGLIQEVGFEGDGCAISKSSASMMTTLIQGKSLRDAAVLEKAFLSFMTSEKIEEEIRSLIGRLSIFEGVREFPIRVKCATLIWHALEDAIRDGLAGGSQPKSTSEGEVFS